MYVAASFEQAPLVAGLRKRLEDYIDITSTWCDEPPLVADDYRNAAREMRSRGNEDFLDIERSDIFCVLTRVKSTSGGLHTELGIALGMRKRIFLVGPRLNVFHHMNVVDMFDDVDSLVNHIEYAYNEGLNL